MKSLKSILQAFLYDHGQTSFEKCCLSVYLFVYRINAKG